MQKDKKGLEDEFWRTAWRNNDPKYYRKGNHKHLHARARSHRERERETDRERQTERDIITGSVNTLHLTLPLIHLLDR